jgi:hypothetical protein
MGQGDLQTFLLIAGFLLLIGAYAWHRHRLVMAMREVPDDVRVRLDWEAPEDLRAVRRHRRRLSRRLVMRGLPEWVPLTREGRRHLFWHRFFGLAAAVWLILAPAAAWGAWFLVPLIGVPALVILGLHAWLDGPWEGT